MYSIVPLKVSRFQDMRVRGILSGDFADLEQRVMQKIKKLVLKLSCKHSRCVLSQLILQTISTYTIRSF